MALGHEIQMMKRIYKSILFLISGLIFGCTPIQPNYPTDTINGICFYNLEDTRINLTDEFKQTLYSGTKSDILRAVEQISDGETLKPRENDALIICDAGGQLFTSYSVYLNIREPGILGGRLILYFDNQDLKAAEVMISNTK